MLLAADCSRPKAHPCAAPGRASLRLVGSLALVDAAALHRLLSLLLLLLQNALLGFLCLAHGVVLLGLLGLLGLRLGGALLHLLLLPQGLRLHLLLGLRLGG
ncbi:hypothetical protein J7E62_06145, partial [Variovorax paradoxus]|nr:hypothetical protein [Variovorax paradoxus]